MHVARNLLGIHPEQIDDDGLHKAREPAGPGRGAPPLDPAYTNPNVKPAGTPWGACCKVLLALRAAINQTVVQGTTTCSHVYILLYLHVRKGLVAPLARSVRAFKTAYGQ